MWLRKHGATSAEIPVYVSHIRELFHQPSIESYEACLQKIQKDWSQPFVQYFMDNIHPEVMQ